MREIKFRLRKGNVIQGYVTLKPNDIISPAYEWDDADQYTGLKDKNGKEIYEGDIVEHYGLVYEVAWERGSFVILGITVRDNPDGSEYQIRNDLLMNENEMVEIIGNKFENPEMLPKETK